MIEQLRKCAGGADRFVIVDTETTGLYNADRVVEIAIFTLSLEGDLLEVFETLINPTRDVSATHIHGITATMVKDAPTFEEIAGDIAVRLHGACFVAHNVPFDRRMLQNEYRRVGNELVVVSSVDTYVASGCQLTDACGRYGIGIDGAHRASADAWATAQLFLRLVEDCEIGSPLVAPAELVRSGRVRRREDVEPVTLPEPPLITFLASRMNVDGLAVRSQQYLEMVARGVADLHLDRDERAELAELAASLDLTEAQIAQSHRRFVNGLIDSATEDDVVTDDEYDALIRVARALSVDQAAAERRIAKFRLEESLTVVTAGMQVVFTGDHPTYARFELEERATQLGLIPTEGVSKQTGLVCAADSATESGKATKARRYGIPVISAEEFVRAHIGDILAGSGAGQASLKVITCPDCFTSTTIPATTTANANRRCDDCAKVAKRSSAPVRTAARPSQGSIDNQGWAPPLIEWLTCRRCTANWHRQITKGRKPHYCQPCAGVAQLPAPETSTASTVAPDGA